MVNEGSSLVKLVVAVVVLRIVTIAMMQPMKVARIPRSSSGLTLLEVVIASAMFTVMTELLYFSTTTPDQRRR